MLKKNRVFALLIILVLSAFLRYKCFAQEQNVNELNQEKLNLQQPRRKFLKDINGYIDLNGYYDSRSFNVFTNNTLLNFPRGIQYFSFTNIFGPFNTADNFTLNKYYTEQNIRWNFLNQAPVDLAFQWVSGSNYKDVLRLGPRLRFQDMKPTKSLFKKLNLIYQVTFFPLQYDRSNGYDAQIEHFYRIQVFPKLFGDRVYISGFADMNLLYGSDNKKNHVPWVTETQLGIRLINQVYFVTEYRFNQILPKNKKNGLALGLEYLIKL